MNGVNMKKTNLNDFDAPVVINNGMFQIQSDDYLNQLIINKIVVLPLRHIQGNIESKTSKDSVIIILSGSGSMEVNGSSVQITAGDVIEVRADETFTVTNDTLESSIQFISVLTKK
jgi:mannose-6-phosphate isomerase-like protein (cupin superfamily)